MVFKKTSIVTPYVFDSFIHSDNIVQLQTTIQKIFFSWFAVNQNQLSTRIGYLFVDYQKLLICLSGGHLWSIAAFDCMTGQKQPSELTAWRPSDPRRRLM